MNYVVVAHFFVYFISKFSAPTISTCILGIKWLYVFKVWVILLCPSLFETIRIIHLHHSTQFDFRRSVHVVNFFFKFLKQFNFLSCNIYIITSNEIDVFGNLYYLAPIPNVKAGNIFMSPNCPLYLRHPF